jgi:hypothetical protein
MRAFFRKEGMMNSPKATGLAQVPRSGDKLVDWVFKQFVFFLRKETVRIKRKRYVFLPSDPHREALYGLMHPKDGNQVDILISAAKSRHCNRDEEVETLIHELSHVVFCVTHPFIYQIEQILVAKFTAEQKNYLKSFIPRHEVKS